MDTMMIVLVLVSWSVRVFLIVAAIYLGLKFVKALERGRIGTDELIALRQRLKELEERADATSEELVRIREGQEFTNHLLQERVQPG
jgi:hypothetical protein